MKITNLFSLGLLISIFWTQKIIAQNLDSIRIESSGIIPKTLTRSTVERMNSESDILDNKKDKKIVSNNIYRIDEILHSGKIVFGSYSNVIIEKILQRIEVSNADLDLSKVEFYIMKSSKINAFSTYQGAICITTGLLANIQNEAQLAYIMCHELVHYLESHTLDTYRFRSKKRKRLEDNEKIDLFSNFSKNQEFEADLNGLEIYLKTGYSIKSSLEALDILEILDRDNTNLLDIDLDTTLFNTETFKVPSYRFKPFDKGNLPSKDTLEHRFESHPEIEERQKRLADQISIQNINETGKEFIVCKPNDIKKLNQLAIHDDVVNCLNERQYIKAIYLAEIAEETYGSSKELKLVKAKSLYALSKKRLLELYNNGLYDSEDKHVKQFLKRLDSRLKIQRWQNNKPKKILLRKDQLLFKGSINVLNDYLNWNSLPIEVSCLALNNLLQINDSNLNPYIEDIIYDLVKIFKVDSNYFYRTYQENIKELEEEPEAIEIDKELSLLEKLTKQKVNSKKPNVIKSTYYRNALVDFWDNPKVKTYFNDARTIFIEPVKSKKEIKLAKKNKEKLNIEKILVMESDNFIIDYSKGLNMLKTAKLKDKLDKALITELERQNIEIVNYYPNSMINENAIPWNENVLIQQFVNEFYSFSEYGVIPLVDVSEIWKTHNTPYVLLSSEMSLQSSLPISTRYVQLVTFPITLMYTMELFSKQCINNYYATIIDLRDLKVVYNKNIENNYTEQEIHKLLKINRVCREIKSL